MRIGPPSRNTPRLAAAALALVVAAGSLALPAEGRKQDPQVKAQTDTVSEPVDPGAVETPTATPPDGTGDSTAPGIPGMPTFPSMPGQGAPDEVGGVIEPGRIAQLVQECASISVAGLAVAAHNCAGGIDVVGTLPPDAPWTVFIASKGGFVMGAPRAMSGPVAEIELPYAAEPLRKWVRRETGIRLRRDR